MPKYATVNDIIIAVGMVTMLVMYWYDELTRNDRSSEGGQRAGETGESSLVYLDYPFLRSAYWYFFGALGCLFLIYLLTLFDSLGKDWNSENQEHLHFLLHVVKTVISNLANVAILVTAVAYGRARNFKSKNAARGFATSALLFALWAMFWELLHHDTSLIYTTLLVSPDIIVSNVALILLGWVFLCRWSGIGVAYFFVMIVYAVLQLPARVAFDLSGFLDPAKHVNLEPTFYFLAAGKIFMVGGFILMVRNVAKDAAEPRFWPRGERISPYPLSLQHVFLALLFAFLVPFVLHWVGQASAGTCCSFFPDS